MRIVGELLAHGAGPVLLTRASDDQIKADASAAHRRRRVRSGTRRLAAARAPRRDGGSLVVSAGTADVAGRRRVRAHAARLRLRTPNG